MKMETKFIIGLAAFVIFLMMFISVPLRILNLKKKSGEKIIALKNGGIKKSVLILIVALFLIFIPFFRDFKIWVQILFCGCALLAENLAMSDFVNFNRCGIYENGIFENGKFIAFSEITSFPVLQLPEEERKNYESNVLILTTKKKGKDALIFADEEEYFTVVTTIFELHPELKTW